MSKKKDMDNLIVPSPWELKLCDALKALHPGIQITSLEEPRALASINVAAQAFAQASGRIRNVTVWSMVSMRVYKLVKFTDPEDNKEKFKTVIEHLKPQRLPQALKTFVEETTEVEGQEIAAPGILVLADVGPVLKGEPAAARALREALFAIRSTMKTIVILGKHISLPQELASEITFLEYALPTKEELVKFLTDLLGGFRKNPKYKNLTPSEDQISNLARGCAGLTENEARNILCNAIVRHGCVDDRAASLALEQKAEIVKRDGIMAVSEPKITLSDVGGLEGIKTYVAQITEMVKQVKAARDYGLRMPPGILAAGVPGCGKSYIMEAIAKVLGLTFLKLDMGSVHGGMVGESESNMRKVFGVAEAVKPCMLFIDEIEKAIGGSGGERDGGTSERVKQSLLTWMQEKSDEIFIAATANDLNKLKGIPELIRAGRMDAVFFVDLPDLKTRIEILGLKLKASGHPMPVDSLEEVGTLTKGYSGAELDRVVQLALRLAFMRNPRPEHPTIDDLKAAVPMQKPLSVTMKEPIDKLRDWCKEGHCAPAGAMLEDDESDEASLKADGLPVI
jgi:ATP-dependent 26S proteasome regulatory subunit